MRCVLVSALVISTLLVASTVMVVVSAVPLSQQQQRHRQHLSIDVSEPQERQKERQRQHTLHLPPDTFRQLAQALYTRGEMDERSRMQRKFLYNRNATCNDGSVAGYYIRRNYESKRWIIFLEGGMICHDANSCGARSSHRMSSDRWPSNRTFRGILSADPEENPVFADANHVFIPYCTSDSWAGTRRATDRTVSFLGAYVLREVVRELADYEHLASTADEVFLAGSSAGGTGVLVNVDAIADMLAPSGVSVRGIVDSGWFLDNQPFSMDCHDAAAGLLGCSIIQSLRQAVDLWRAYVPESCKDEHKEERWKCFLGYKVFPHIKTPLFIFQWQFDEFQLYADNVVFPTTPEQWQYIFRTGNHLRTSLNNASYVFSPACIAHEVLTKNNWNEVTVDGVTLPEALECWMTSIQEEPVLDRKYKVIYNALAKEVDEPDEDLNRPVGIHRTASMMSDSPQTYKLARNLVRSISTKGDNPGPIRTHEKYRNSINSHLETRREHRNFDSGFMSDDNEDDRHHRRRQRRRHGHHRNIGLKHLRGQGGGSLCNTNSNTCKEPVTSTDNDVNSLIRNIDLVRSLDRRSSHKLKNDLDNDESLSEKEKRRRRRRMRRRRRRRLRKMRRRLRNDKDDDDDSNDEKDEEDMENDEEKAKRREERRRRRRERKKRLRRQRRRERRRMRRLQKTLSKVREGDEGAKGGEAHHHVNVRSVVDSPTVQSAFSQSRKKRTASKSCRAKLIDSCSWPHCNPSCPKLKNFDTGQDMDILALLRSFGMDMNKVAKALDVDIATLNNMDGEVLLHLLTSQNE